MTHVTVNAVVEDGLPVPRDLRVAAGVGCGAGTRGRAVAEGRRAGLITLDEFTERTDTALAAQTRGELNTVLTDLPFVHQTERPRGDEAAGAADSVGQRGAARALGRAGEIIAECGMGNVTIDFTEAICPHPEVTLRATCGAGNIIAGRAARLGCVLAQADRGMGSVTNKATRPAGRR